MILIHMPIISFVICMGLLSLTVGGKTFVNNVEDTFETADLWEDKCEDSLVNYFGSNHSRTIEFMSGVTALFYPEWDKWNPIVYPGNIGYSECGATQMLLNLIISRNLQNSSDSIIPMFQKFYDSIERKGRRYYMEGENQTPEEQKEVIDSLKFKLLHQNKPVISACYLVNNQDKEADLIHTFVIHKTKPDSFRIYQSLLGQYDLYSWFTQNLEDRLSQTVTTASEISGVLSNVTMTNFINKLEYLISGKAPLNEILDYAKNGFWGSSHLNPPHSTFINIICENVDNYRIEDDCQIGINNVEKKLREIGFIR